MIQVGELDGNRTDCAWCHCGFDEVVDLLEHVELCHLDDPEPGLDAAA
jgi:hypothetical protein